MRIVSALSIGLLCSAFALPANAEVCPSGSQWVPPGYVAKGAWQIGHCSAWSGGAASNYQEGWAGAHGSYGQPSPTGGMPGGWQPSASSHPPAYMLH
jgi:hypothetical protein